MSIPFKFICTVLISLLCTNIGAQTTATTDSKPVANSLPTVTVERSSFSPGIFGGKWGEPKSETITLIQKNDTQTYYKSEDSLVIFDRFGFAYTNPLPSESYELTLTTDRVLDPTADAWAIGKKWATKYNSPNSKSSRCASDTVEIDVSTQVMSEKTVPIKINGKEQDTKVVQLKTEGLWKLPAMCGNTSGKIITNILYAPTLNIIVNTEIASYWGSMHVFGTRSSLVEFKTQ